MKELYFEYKTKLFKKRRVYFNEDNIKYVMDSYLQLKENYKRVDVYYDGKLILENDVMGTLMKLSYKNIVIKTSEGVELLTILLRIENNLVKVDWVVKNKELVLENNMTNVNFYYFIKRLINVNDIYTKSMENTIEIIKSYTNIFNNEDYDISYNI